MLAKSCFLRFVRLSLLLYLCLCVFDFGQSVELTEEGSKKGQDRAPANPNLAIQLSGLEFVLLLQKILVVQALVVTLSLIRHCHELPPHLDLLSTHFPSEYCRQRRLYDRHHY